MNRKKLQKLTDTLTKNCKHFNTFEVNCLIKLFYNLVGEGVERQGTTIGLDRNAFRNILHVTFGMTDDMIMDRVFRGFDKDNDGCVNVTEWVCGLSLFLRGSLEEKMKYCFEVFDLNGDGFISKEEMFHMLKNSLLKQPSEEDPDEGIKDLVEITLKKMVIMDYEQAVREETLLLEAFGPCLPDPKSQMEFEAQVFKDPHDFNDM
nr:EF-hand calcium-binding domain-containing protein 1 isoform X2 [Microcebus murinus]